MFVARIDTNGKAVFAKAFAGASDTWTHAVAVDPSGNVYVTGDVTGAIDFGAGSLAPIGGTDVYLAKFDPTGALLWAKRFGGSGGDSGWALAADALGVVVAGKFTGTMDLGGGPLVDAGAGDVFVARFDAAGGHVFSKRFGDAKAQEARAVAIDATGALWIGGDFEGTLDFGVASFSTLDATDGWAAKLSSAGAPLAARSFGVNNNYDYVYALSALPGGGAVVGGSFSASLTVGASSWTSKGGDDAFLVAYDSSMTPAWTKVWGATGAQAVTGIATDGKTGLFVTGYFADSVDFGGGALVSAGNEDVFAARFSTSGAHAWSARWGDGARQTSAGIATDSGGRSYVGGTFWGNMLFGAPGITSAGGYDAFLAKLAP